MDGESAEQSREENDAQDPRPLSISILRSVSGASVLFASNSCSSFFFSFSNASLLLVSRSSSSFVLAAKSASIFLLSSSILLSHSLAVTVFGRSSSAGRLQSQLRTAL